MAIRKNRSEKGSRAEPIGSKPHSYGESFSWSGIIRGSQKETVARIAESSIVIEKIVISRLIIFPWDLTKTGWLEVTYTEFDTRKIKNLISRLRCKGTVRQRLQSVNIMRLLQNQSGGWLWSDVRFGGVGRLLGMLSQLGRGVHGSL